MFLKNGWYVRGEVHPVTAWLLSKHKVLFSLTVALMICLVGHFPRSTLAAAVLLYAGCNLIGRLRQHFSDKVRLFSPESHGIVYWAVIKPLEGVIWNGTVDAAVLDEFLEWFAGHITVTSTGPWGITSSTPINPNEWRLQIELLTISVAATAPQEAERLRDIARSVTP